MSAERLDTFERVAIGLAAVVGMVAWWALGQALIWALGINPGCAGCEHPLGFLLATQAIALVGLVWWLVRSLVRKLPADG